MNKKIKFLDTNIKNKNKTIENRIQLYEHNNNKFPLPTEIEISESGTCNRKCSFCPRSAPDFEDKKEFISEKLIIKVAKELNSLNYAGVIRFSGFVEPMLDKKIYNHIRNFKFYLPDCRIEMVSNGDPLNAERLKKLFVNGLDKILISAYDGAEDVKKFEEMVNKCELNSDQYIIRDRSLPEEEDFGITLSNRSGMMENAEYKIAKLKNPLNNPCYIPSYTLFFDYLGDVLICPHDWGKKIILGNLQKENLLDIWFKEKSMRIRKKLSNRDRKFSPCNVCDVNGTLMGELNSKYYM